MKRLMAVLAFVVLGSAAAAQPVPSVEDYAAMTNMSSVRISPNGENVVFISGENRADRNIIVTSLTGRGSNVIDGGDDQVVVNVSWINDERIIITYSERRNNASSGDREDRFRRYVMDPWDSTNNWELNEYASIANRAMDDPEHFLVWLPVLRDNRASRAEGGDVEQAVGLFRQGLRRDRDRNRVFIGDGGFTYILNAENEPIVRYGSDDNQFELWYRPPGSGWSLVHEERWRLLREFQFGPRSWGDWVGVIESVGGVDASGRYAYFTSETTGESGALRPGRRSAVYRFDLQEERIEGPILESDLADVGSFIRDWRTNAVVGVSYNEERPVVHYFDPEFADLQTQLEGFFPDSNPTIVSWDSDFRKVVVHFEGGHTSGEYYLLDRISGEVALLSASRPRIPNSAVAPVEIVHYEARDGLELFGYLTLPPGRDARNLPAVMLPHGGPEARDYYGYDEWAQLLAARGYAVFQMQFRGSDGFGQEFVERGYTRWGREMQNDIDDGMDHLVAEGVIDPDRTCLFGWSYGGYAALAGATMTPDRYRCVIAGAAVSDILAMMDYERSRGNGDSQAYWSRNIGDWRGREDEMREISPAHLAHQVQAPLMIVHGTDDIIVPYSQAEIMARALDEAGKEYELVAIEDGPHQSYRMTVNDKLELYRNLERFLFEHNPPDPQG